MLNLSMGLFLRILGRGEEFPCCIDPSIEGAKPAGIAGDGDDGFVIDLGAVVVMVTRGILFASADEG